MIFVYGGYRALAGEVKLASDNATTIFGPRGKALHTKRQLIIEGVLLGENTALNALVAAVQDGFAHNAGDAVLYFGNDDATPIGSLVASKHALNQSASMGGIKVDSLQWIDSDGELATKRTYRATLTAHYDANESNLVDSSETIQFQGTGGGDFGHVQTLNGRPIRQTLSEFTVVTAVQSGFALGYSSPPSPTPPYWPQYEKLKQRQFVPGVPKLVDNAFRFYPFRWQYYFEANQTFYRLPTPRIS